jgi:hypothetical protein
MYQFYKCPVYKCPVCETKVTIAFGQECPFPTDGKGAYACPKCYWNFIKKNVPIMEEIEGKPLG